MLGDMREEKKLSHITPLSPTLVFNRNRNFQLCRPSPEFEPWIDGLDSP